MYDGPERRAHGGVPHEVRRLLVLFFITIVVLCAVVIGGLNWFQYHRQKDQDRLIENACRELNRNRAASNRNATVLVAFLRQAEKTRRAAAKLEDGEKREADLRAASVYDQLADSYSILPILQCTRLRR